MYKNKSLHNLCILCDWLNIEKLSVMVSGAITLGQNGPVSNSNEGLLHIPQSCSTRALLTDCSMWDEEI